MLGIKKGILKEAALPANGKHASQRTTSSVVSQVVLLISQLHGSYAGQGRGEGGQTGLDGRALRIISIIFHSSFSNSFSTLAGN